MAWVKACILLLLYEKNSLLLLYMYLISSHLFTTCALWKKNLIFRERIEETWRSLRERETWRVRAELGEPRLIQCFSVDLVEGKVDLVFASAAATSDLNATICSDLGELTHSFDLSLYFVSLLNNWYLIEEESSWVFPWSLDLNSLCLILFLVVFYCAFGLCSIYNWLTNIAEKKKRKKLWGKVCR